MKAFWLSAGKRAGLLGFGLSNQTLLDFLLDRGLAITVRERRPLDRPDLTARGVRLVTGDGYLDGMDEDILFRSPGLRPDLPPIQRAVENGAILSGEYDLFAALCPATLLGVGLADVDIKDHIKNSFLWVWGFSILCMIFAITVGIMPL